MEFSKFSADLLKALRNCLQENITEWGILIAGPDSKGQIDILAAVYDVAIAEGGDDGNVNLIIDAASKNE